VHRRGLDSFRADVARTAPPLADRVSEIDSWDRVKLLTVAVDRLKRWYRSGLVCIGDAAHAMSPIGGVGINLAIQDAVAAANILAGPLRQGAADDATLAAIQNRREFPTRVTQRMQVFLQERVIRKVLTGEDTLKPPLFLKLLAKCPQLRRIPARLIGMGIRPEHVRTPERAA
jgi:2-polyprenyl-6-methoxyphenol hydroxylase-like FAD-dependent oxidoreductase